MKKVEKLAAHLHDKTEYIFHIKKLKQALNHKLILKKVYRVITFNQKTWLKAYVDMNTELRKEGINAFEKDFFKLMNNSDLSKTIENLKNVEIPNL